MTTVSTIMNRCRSGAVLHVVLLALLAGGIYVRTLDGEFIWDDSGLILENSDYFESARGITPLFTSSPMGSAPYYRPLLWLSFLGDYLLWQRTPRGFHLTNILLHMFCTAALYGLLRVLTARPPLCAAAAALFAVHPINTEAVAWIAGRNDPLMTLCILLTCLLFRRTMTVSRNIAAFLCAAAAACWYAAALLVKESAMITLALLPLLERCSGMPRVASPSRRRPLFLALLLLTVLFLFVRHTLSPDPAFRLSFQPHGRSAAFCCAVYLYYLKTLLFPVNLTVDPSFFIARLADPVAALVYVVVFAAILITVIICSIRWREGAGGMLWVLVYLLPVSGIVWMGVPILEHRAYGACAGFCVVLACLWYRGAHAAGRGRRVSAAWIAGIALCAVLLLYGVLTLQRSRIWHNELALWTDTFEKSPHSPQAMINLGVALLRRNQPDRALALFDKARERLPRSSRIYNNIGSALYALGRHDEALAAQQQALRCDPRSAEAYHNMGIIHRDRGDDARAAACFETAVALKPTYVAAVQQLARLHLKRNEPDRAVAVVRSALALMPRNSLLHNELGKAQAQAGRTAEAIETFGNALRYDPSQCDALNNLALLYIRLGKFRDALPYALHAAQLMPEAPELHMNCGIIHMNLGNLTEAVAAYETAIRLRPAYADAYFNLGVVLMMQRADKECIKKCFEKVLFLNPDYPNKNQVLKIIEKLSR